MGFLWKSWTVTVIFTFLSSILVGYSATRFQSTRNEITQEESDSIQVDSENVNSEDPLIVQTTLGKVSGFYSYSRDGREYREFLGIPYAKAPVGELRFEAPLPPERWDGIREATKYGSKCLQFDMFIDMTMGGEDCLYLQVFSPKKILQENDKHFVKDDLFPVIVFVHGGLFMYGGSDEYRPEYYMDEDVVVVTLNYRLNSFGFLNTGDEVVRGNMGLKDQTMALKWVQENIKNFGGDPKKVALVGQSAGAASVHLHMLSPLSKGLFQRAISLSGNALNSWAMVKTPKEQAKRYGERLKCPTISSKDLVKCLRSLDASEIIQSHEEIKNFLNERISHFAPSLEAINDSNAFLTQNPEDLMRSGNIANKVPWVTGVNSEDGLIYVIGMFWSEDSAVDKINKYWRSYAPILFEYDDIPEKKRDEISMKIKSHYLHNEDISEKNIRKTVALFQDAGFNHALHRSVLLHSKHHPVFIYYYSHSGNFGFYQVFNAMTKSVPKLIDWLWALTYRWFNYDVLGQDEEKSVCHGDDNVFFFKIPLISNIKEGSTDFYLSKSLVHTWTTFAKEGDPKDFQGVAWPYVQPQDTPFHYMRLANHSELIAEPFEKSLTYWENEILKTITESRTTMISKK